MSVLTKASNLVRAEDDPRVIRAGQSSLRGVDQLGRALGWFSIALGVSQVFAASRYSRALGVQGRESLIRGCGLREIGAGVLTLSTERRAGLWSRVGGDALDIALLCAALPRNRRRGSAALALALVGGITVLDVFAAQTATARHSRRGGTVRDYRDRSGYPHGIERSRAAGTFRVPAEMTSEPLLGRTSQPSGSTSHVSESLMAAADRSSPANSRCSCNSAKKAGG
jgi:hypothetical protein